MGFFEKVFGTHSERELKKIMPLVNKIESLRDTMVAMSDAELRAQTDKFKNATRTARAWTLCFRRPSRLSARQRAA